MEFVLLFTLTAFGSLSLWIVVVVATSGLQRTRRTLGALALRYLQTPHLIRRRSFWPCLTPADLLVWVAACGVAAIGNMMFVHDKMTAGKRGGWLSTICLAPLFLGANLDFAGELTGLSLRRVRTFHKVLATVALAEAAVHLCLLPHAVPVRSNVIYFFGTMALACIVFLFLSRLFARTVYETFMLAHTGVSLTLIAMVSLHLRDTPAVRLVGFIMGALAATTAIRVLRAVYRNARRTSSRPGPRWTQVWFRALEHGLVRIRVELPERWQIRHGQYVRVTIPRLNAVSWFQAHPFMIADWTGTARSPARKGAQELDLFALPMRGWTESVLGAASHTHVHSRIRMSAIVDGPYGRPCDHTRYEEVILVATGIGIFAHLPHINQLAAGGSKTRRLRIWWEVDHFRQLAWLRKVIQHPLNQDVKRKILEITVIYRREDKRQLTEEQGLMRDGIVLRHDPAGIDWDETLGTELTQRHRDDETNLLISVSASAWVRDEIDRVIR